MSDFTPAPWHDHIDDDGELYVEMGDGHYAYFGDVENTCGTCHANARLTAAAPDMYEALVAFDAARTSPELHEALKLAHAALRKARADDE